MKRWMMMAIAAGVVTIYAKSQESDPKIQISDKEIIGGSIGMQRDAMKQNAGTATPEMQQMMIEHRKQLREKLGSTAMMHQPKAVKTMLSNMLDDPETVKKVLNDNPVLKAKLIAIL
jgi:hypothetical protein